MIKREKNEHNLMITDNQKFFIIEKCKINEKISYFIKK